MALITNKKLPSTILCCFITAILLATFGYLCFGNLSEWHIEDYDEARHGINAYEMIQNEDYLVHTFQGETDLWNTKPPLSFWAITLGYKIFGYNALGLRFFSALASMLAVLAILIWAVRYYGKWAAPFILAIFTANSILYGLHFLRFGDADSQYQMFFTLAMLCLLLSHKKFSWLYGCGLFFSLAFMEKSIHSLMIPAVCFFSLLFTGRLKELTWKRVLLLLLSGLTIVLIWAVARISRDGFDFFTSSFELDVAGRVGGGIAEPEYADMNVFVYNFLAIFCKPAMWICLGLSLLSGAWILIRKIKLSPFTKHAVIASLMWLFIPIILYSIVNVKFRWYVYSGLMAVPLLTCILVFTVIRSGFPKKLSVVIITLFAAAMVTLSVFNVIDIATIEFDHTIQEFIIESLDRDLDEGKHAYILYAENGSTEWLPGSMLTAMMYGDVVCLDGGLEAFLEDDENSLLFIARTNNEDTIEYLMGQEIIFYENYYCVAFEKY